MGRKTVFLYPPAVLDDAIDKLSNSEFEVLRCKNHEKLARWLVKEPESIVFINLDEALKEPEWEAWIRARGDVSRLGILTYNDNQALKAKYLMGIGLGAGFVVLKIGAAQAAQILLKTLEANEARGQRKYLRSKPWPGAAEYNIASGSDIERGPIHDVSVVGMTVSFVGAAPPQKGAKLRGIQLSLKGQRLTVDAVVFGQREDPNLGLIHILVFDPASMDDIKRDKIRSYVRRSLQESFEAELAALI
jgi:hypothetical protein